MEITPLPNQESLRLYPPAPMIARTALKDDEMPGDYFITKDVSQATNSIIFGSTNVHDIVNGLNFNVRNSA